MPMAVPRIEPKKAPWPLVIGVWAFGQLTYAAIDALC